MKGPPFRQDIVGGKWKTMRGQITVTWTKLTNDDLDQVGGKFDKFVSLLEEKYGFSRERAEEEVNRQIAEHDGQ